MQIQDLSEIFKFIGNMSCAGILAFILCIGILIYIILDTRTSKDLGFKITARNKFIAISFTLVLAVLLFKVESNQQSRYLRLANQLKSGMAFYKFKDITINDIIITYSIIDTATFDSNDIITMISKYPSEFSSFYTSDTSQTLGVRIIDPEIIAIIDNYRHEHLPYIKNSILNYMLENSIDTISFEEIGASINDFFDAEWIELMAANYDTVFIPITINSRSDKYDIKYGLKLKLDDYIY